MNELQVFHDVFEDDVEDSGALSPREVGGVFDDDDDFLLRDRMNASQRHFRFRQLVAQIQRVSVELHRAGKEIPRSLRRRRSLIGTRQ